MIKKINIDIDIKEVELLFMMLAKCDPNNIFLSTLKQKINFELQKNIITEQQKQ